jgi:RNA polymerase-interacting CarD/CdnL/TRCF family regulator
MTNAKNAEVVYVHYEMVWGSDKVFTASIPLENMKKAGTRKVFTTTEAEQILKDLKSVKVENKYTTMLAKEEIYANNPSGVISVLIYYWQNAALMNKADRDLMEQVLECLCQEIALVTKKKYDDVRKTITSILDKRIPVAIV